MYHFDGAGHVNRKGWVSAQGFCRQNCDQGTQPFAAIQQAIADRLPDPLCLSRLDSRGHFCEALVNKRTDRRKLLPVVLG